MFLFRVTTNSTPRLLNISLNNVRFTHRAKNAGKIVVIELRETQELMLLCIQSRYNTLHPRPFSRI